MSQATLASEIYLYDPNVSWVRTERTYLIYYVPGNPALVEYYRTFLTHLYGLLTKKLSTSQNIQIRVYGRSLPGFETSDAERSAVDSPGPYDVEQQIQFSCQSAKNVVEKLRKEGHQDVRVILMGHSLGTYVSMEVIRWLREDARKDPQNGVRVVGGVCLFTTIMNLAGSPSGRKSVRLLSVPYFALAVSQLVKIIFLVTPVHIVALLIRFFLGFPSDAAHVTASFLKSPRGVRQALHMAHDEMLTITTDKWDEEIWGAAHPSSHPHPRPTLRFLFGKTDHWVANETRDELIRARGANGKAGEVWKPTMEVEEEGWPHDFCIKHSIPVAERVYGYVEAIIKADLTTS